jgi:diaminopimelate decarboxylase
MLNFETNFLNSDQAHELAAEHGTPLFVYSRAVLQAQAQAVLGVPAPFGLTVRFAMKANPHSGILQLLREEAVKIDASSGYEAALAMEQGFAPQDILITTQQVPHNLKDLGEQGVQFNATSLRQLEAYGQLFPGSDVTVRINPGIGSGHSVKTNVGGLTSSFGIWHEYIPQVQRLAEKYKLKIVRLHTHIGSGADPAVWQQAAHTSLKLIKQFPEAHTINLGGGFKVARMDGEPSADMSVVGRTLAAELENFAQQTGRELHLELEPGSFLTASAGILIASVEDSVDTGPEGYTFLKLDTGMNDFMRPTLYGAQHPIAIVSDNTETTSYVVVGHNCESGDLLTPAPGQPDVLGPRNLTKAQLGDLVLIGGTGAYCASMAAHGYNSYPNAKEVLI